jgi:hypothetical protein
MFFLAGIEFIFILAAKVDCDQKVMGLPPVTAVFLIAKSFW